jgi:hypothetical protein
LDLHLRLCFHTSPSSLFIISFELQYMTIKNLTKLFSISIIGLILGSGLFWIFSKTAYYQKITKGDFLIVQEAVPVLYVVDQDVGPKLLPHTKIHYRTPYFDTTVVTNKDGFTGRDYPIQTSNYRIAIMGDSAVESYGVADTNRFPHQTEEMVYKKTKGQLKVEVMGFGVSGWGSVHQYGAIKKYVLKYKPNEIWIEFLPTNDFGDNTPLMNSPPLGPTFVYENASSNKIVDIKFGYPDIPDALNAERKRRYGEKNLSETWGLWASGLLPYYWSSEKNPIWDLIEDHTFQTFRLIKELCDKNKIKMTLVYRVTGYDHNKANFEEFKKDTAKFLKYNLSMEQELGLNRFRNKVESMGINFINTLEMKELGITTKAEETEVPKHQRMADFFSDKIIEKLGAKGL